MNNTKRGAPLLGKETAMNLGILKDGEEAVIKQLGYLVCDVRKLREKPSLSLGPVRDSVPTFPQLTLTLTLHDLATLRTPSQGVKLRLIQAPMRLNFSLWRPNPEN